MFQQRVRFVTKLGFISYVIVLINRSRDGFEDYLGNSILISVSNYSLQELDHFPKSDIVVNMRSSMYLNNLVDTRCTMSFLSYSLKRRIILLLLKLWNNQSFLRFLSLFFLLFRINDPSSAK